MKRDRWEEEDEREAVGWAFNGSAKKDGVGCLDADAYYVVAFSCCLVPFSYDFHRSLQLMPNTKSQKVYGDCLLL